MATVVDTRKALRDGATHVVLVDGSVHAINWLSGVGPDDCIMLNNKGGDLCHVGVIRSFQYNGRATG